MTTAHKLLLLNELRLRLAYDDIRPCVDPDTYDDMERRAVDALAEVVDILYPPRPQVQHRSLPGTDGWWLEQETLGFTG